MLRKISFWLKALFFNKKNITPEVRTSLEDFFKEPIGNIMIPRSDIFAVYTHHPFEEVVQTFLKTGASILPVCRNMLDHILGIVSVQDILSLSQSKGASNWMQYVKKASFVPASMMVGEAIYRMQHPKTILFIVDEHGGIEGMLTPVHIFKELTLTFFDDMEAEQQMVISRSPIFVISSRMDLETFEEELNALHLFTDEDEKKVNTIGGWLCSFIGRVPEKGEIIHHPSGFVFEIVQADPRRIYQIAVLSNPHTQGAEASDEKSDQ